MAEMAVEPITLTGVKRKLVGLDAWLCAAASSEAQYDDEAITDLIPDMTRNFERETQFRVVPVQVVAFPDGAYALPGQARDVTNTYDVYEEQPYPYYAQTAQEYLTTYLRQRPIRQVQRFRLMLDPNTLVYSVPSTWYRFEPRSGRFSLQPVSGSVTLLGATTALATIQMNFGANSYIPQLMAFDYIAGLPFGWEQTREWADVRRAVEEYCAYAVLCDIGELFDAGKLTKTISANGLSQSLNYSRFQQRKDELLRNVMRVTEQVKAQETPLMLSVV